MKRRDAFVLMGLGGLAAGWQMFGVRKPSVDFAPLSGVPGWQFARVGGVSGLSGSDFVTIGLEKPPEPLPLEAFEDVVHRDKKVGAVPVAVFSDFFCPYCRGLIGRLSARSDKPSLAITWHELPLLGPNSVLAAKAAEAAALQGGYKEFYTTLVQEGFRPSHRWFAQVAERAGLDGARLLNDMDGMDVADRLDASARAASMLGFSGTPGIAIGKFAILGALERTAMEDVFARVGVTPL